MRTLEIFTAVLLFITWGGYMAPPGKRPRALGFLPFITVVIALVQIIVEEYRWQMVPIYTLAAVLFMISLPQLLGQSRKKTAPMQIIQRRGFWSWVIKIVGILLGEAVLLMAIALPALIPVSKLPEPTGPYGVGTTDYEWADESRLETLTTAPNDHRDLLVRVWYPADINPVVNPLQSKPALYWPEVKKAGPLLAKTFGMPPFIFDYVGLIRSHSYPKAPPSPAAKTFPVLLFSHGYLGAVNQNTVQMEELASHGYIIFSIAHPYDALEVVYPSGRMIPASPVSTMTNSKLQSIWARYLSASNPETQAKYYRQILVMLGELQTSLNAWTDDTIFVLNEIERINQSHSKDILAGRMDLGRVGIFGHSFGGTTAAQACQRDSRFKAAVNLDGFLFGDSLDYPIQQPLMMMYSQSTGNCNEPIYNPVGNNTLYRLYIKTATHMNYADFSLWSPLFKYIGVLGSIDGTRMEVIVNDFLRAFFDKYLKGIDTPLLDGADPARIRASHPEVDFQVRRL